MPEMVTAFRPKIEALAHRHDEADDVFGVHGFGSVENGGRKVRTHFECAAVFVPFLEKIQPGNRAPMRTNCFAIVLEFMISCWVARIGATD